MYNPTKLFLKSRSLRDLPGLNESDWSESTLFVTGHSRFPPQQRLCARVDAELLKAGEFLTSSIKSLFIGCRNRVTQGKKKIPTGSTGIPESI